MKNIVKLIPLAVSLIIIGTLITWNLSMMNTAQKTVNSQKDSLVEMQVEYNQRDIDLLNGETVTATQALVYAKKYEREGTVLLKYNGITGTEPTIVITGYEKSSDPRWKFARLLTDPTLSDFNTSSSWVINGDIVGGDLRGLLFIPKDSSVDSTLSDEALATKYNNTTYTKAEVQQAVKNEREEAAAAAMTNTQNEVKSRVNVDFSTSWSATKDRLTELVSYSTMKSNIEEMLQLSPTDPDTLVATLNSRLNETGSHDTLSYKTMTVAAGETAEFQATQGFRYITLYSEGGKYGILSSAGSLTGSFTEEEVSLTNSGSMYYVTNKSEDKFQFDVIYGY